MRSTPFASRGNIGDDVEFSAEDATRTDIAYLEQISKAVVEAGARTVNLPDTTGYSVHLNEYGKVDRTDLQGVGRYGGRERPLPRDDLGSWRSRIRSPLSKTGARQILRKMHAVNGIGERAGNAALEECVMAFKVRHDASCRSTRRL